MYIKKGGHTLMIYFVTCKWLSIFILWIIKTYEGRKIIKDFLNMYIFRNLFVESFRKCNLGYRRTQRWGGGEKEERKRTILVVHEFI